MARLVSKRREEHFCTHREVHKEQIMVQGTLTGRKVAFLATDGVQEQELARPWEAVLEAGGTAELVSIKSGEIRSVLEGKEGRSFPVDKLVTDVTYRDYDGLVIPGGVKNPDTLRMNEDAVEFVRNFMEHDGPVAAICHGPWLLVEADTVRGRTLTSYPSLKTDIQNAGGIWVDRQVEIDQRLVTSRTPKDLNAFCDALVTELAEAIAERSLDNMVEQSFPASDPLPGPTAIGGSSLLQSQ
jgi:protease I